MIRRWSMFANGLAEAPDGNWVEWKDVAALLDVLHMVISQVCRGRDGTLDSMAMTDYADAMRLLADNGRIVITTEHGRRVIATDSATPNVPKAG